MTTQEELETFVEFWQPRLGLSDWRIRAMWEGDLEVQGRVYWEAGMMDATILVCPLSESGLMGRDPIQKTVLHEMIHLTYAVYGDPCPDWVENVVNTTAMMIFNANYSVRTEISLTA